MVIPVSYTHLDVYKRQVHELDVREGAAHHDLMITAACAIGVEISGKDAMLFKIARCRRIERDGSCR